MPPVGPSKTVVVATEPEKVKDAKVKHASIKERLRQARASRAEKRATGQVTREAEAQVELLERQAAQAKGAIAREKEQAKLIKEQAAVQKGLAATSAAQRELLKEELKRQRLVTKEAKLASKERQRAQKERLRQQKKRLAASRAKDRKLLFKL